jgi:hypothetical protein
MKKKDAQMEMSVGTIVTIVLLMTVLILGLILVRSIFSSSVDNIKGIDQAVKNEIKKIFEADSSKKIAVYPETRIITIKKGSDDSGFGFSIRNVYTDASTFSYEVSAVETDCPNSMTLSDADSLISLGKKGDNIQIPASSIMENEIFVRFNIPETVPACKVRYNINVNKAGTVYISSVGIDLFIKSG